MFKTAFSFVLPVILALSAAFLLACGGEATVSSAATSFDASLKALTGTGGMLLVPKEIKGTYGADCKINGGGTWDLKLNEPSDNGLTVALNDTLSNCPLTLTTIRVQEGNRPVLVDYAVVPPIVLSVGYATAAATVKSPNGLAFYTNAKLDGLAELAYTNDFTISMLYSDNAAACGNIAPPAIYGQVTATATGSPVPAPNYYMSFDSLQLVVDVNKIVQNASSGNIVLEPPKDGGQPGEEYKIFDEGGPCCGGASFEEIDNVYRNSTPVPGGTGTITDPGPVTIPWTSFGLLGKKLRQDRFIIVKHMGAGGVYSYELLDVAFPGPRP